MRHLVPLLVTLYAAACAVAPSRPVPVTEDPHLAVAYRVLSTTPLVDGHNDLPWVIRSYAGGPMDVAAYDLRGRTSGHTDIPRLREGMVGGQFWSVWIPAGAVEDGAARIQLEQIDIVHRMIREYPEAFELALRADDVERIFRQGRIASMIGMEGGHALENSLGALRSYYDLGARYMTLTHSSNVDWADSCCEAPDHGGLTAFGREVVREMNRLGMLVDISHVSPEVMHQVLELSEAPVIFSHSSALAVTDHVRNVPDDVLRRMPENGGVVMVTYVNSFVNEALRQWQRTPREQRVGPAPRATLTDVADHMEHVRRVAGIDHVGIGSDYDGATMPEGLEDVSTFPRLLAELSRRGWSEADLRKLAGENVLRAWREAERVASRLQGERPASTATIEALDGPVAAGAGAYVTRLGADTLAVERFAFAADGFDATVVLRAPRTSYTVYRGELDRHGNLRRLTATSYDPSGPEPDWGVPFLARTVYRFGGAGQVHVVRTGGGERTERAVDAPADAVPFIDMVHWPYELGLFRMVGTGEFGGLPMITGARAQEFEITRRGASGVTIRHPFRGSMEAEIDAAGRILSLDAGGTTRAVVVERVADVDVHGLANRFAAADAAGRGVGALSGRGEAVGSVGAATVVVDYGVPLKRGREIFGALVRYGEVWRTGANRATHLTTDRDLVIGQTRVPAGTYTLFTIPGPDAWTLIVNRRTDIGGTAYDASADLVRVPMRVRTLPDVVEAFTIRVDPEGAGGVLRIRWDRTEASVPVRAVG